LFLQQCVICSPVLIMYSSVIIMYSPVLIMYSPVLIKYSPVFSDALYRSVMFTEVLCILLFMCLTNYTLQYLQYYMYIKRGIFVIF
jgi:hypothetical protein